MPRKTITSAIQFCLENLGLQDYNKFCSGLLDRREGKRVPRSKVEGKDFLEVVRVLVSTFCENGALQVTLEILRDIDCNVDAEQLEADAEAIGQGSKPGSNDNEHFVDKYRSQLIASVSSIAPILDELLQQKVIQQESYDKIMARPICQEKVRELYSGPLKGGTACKDAFYRCLKKHEPYLLEELKKGH